MSTNADENHGINVKAKFAFTFDAMSAKADEKHGIFV
jgi:hypothetical protein